MAPKSSTSSEGSELPQRHRPGIGNLARDTTEEDLWDIDGEVPALAPKPRGGKGPAVESEVSEVPAPDELVAGEDLPAAEERTEIEELPEEEAVPLEALMPSPRSGRSDHVRRNLPGRQGRSKESRTGSGGESSAVGELDGLGLWDDLAEAAVDAPAEVRAEAVEAVEPEIPLPRPLEEKVTKEKVQPGGREAKMVEHENEFEEEFAPAVRTDRPPVSLVPKLALNPLEKIGLMGFVVLMLAGGIFFFAHSIQRLPSEDGTASEVAYPVQGVKVSVESAATYWREPTGAEIVRRDTVLIPAVDLKVGGGPGAIRVFFNDESGQRVGDPINRAVEGEALLTFAATAGFENFSMHQAYRAGESKPWTIEVFEGPSVNATGDSFKKLLEISVSADRR